MYGGASVGAWVCWATHVAVVRVAVGCWSWSVVRVLALGCLPLAWPLTQAVMEACLLLLAVGHCGYAGPNAARCHADVLVQLSRLASHGVMRRGLAGLGSAGCWQGRGGTERPCHERQWRWVRQQLGRGGGIRCCWWAAGGGGHNCVGRLPCACLQRGDVHLHWGRPGRGSGWGCPDRHCLPVAWPVAEFLARQPGIRVDPAVNAARKHWVGKGQHPRLGVRQDAAGRGAGRVPAHSSRGAAAATATALIGTTAGRCQPASRRRGGAGPRAVTPACVCRTPRAA